MTTRLKSHNQFPLKTSNRFSIHIQLLKHNLLKSESDFRTEREKNICQVNKTCNLSHVLNLNRTDKQTFSQLLSLFQQKSYASVLSRTMTQDKCVCVCVSRAFYFWKMRQTQECEQRERKMTDIVCENSLKMCHNEMAEIKKKNKKDEDGSVWRWCNLD